MFLKEGIALFSIDWPDILIRIGAAVVIGGVVGVEREYKNRPAGMRTHVLVCLGACIIALLECLMRQELNASSDEGQITMTMGRLSAQVISGIGFLGAGTIFSSQKKIAGLTTAASLWTVACMGLLTGFGFYYVAGACCLLVLIVLTFLQRIIRVNAIKRVEVRFIHRTETLSYINKFLSKNGVKILDVDFHVENKADGQTHEFNVYTNLYTLHLPTRFTYTDIVNELSEHPNIQAVRTRNT
ncbi:MAG: MgtC/SapB family protein [Clostridiales bacterium]|nr:MgtC/SapB family protein [Clostridiales bacterium]